ncbi:MAG: hypothetical protein ACK559_34365, partial [bacterium]
LSLSGLKNEVRIKSIFPHELLIPLIQCIGRHHHHLLLAALLLGDLVEARHEVEEVLDDFLCKLLVEVRVLTHAYTSLQLLQRL